MAYAPTDKQVEAARRAQVAEDAYIRFYQDWISVMGTYSGRHKSTQAGDLWNTYVHMLAELYDMCEYAVEQVHASRAVALVPVVDPVEQAKNHPPVARHLAMGYDAEGNKVPSSNIHSYGYNARLRFVDIMFTSSERFLYRYLDVSQAEYDSLELAASKGKYINQYIKKHQCIKIDLEDMTQK